MLDYSIKKQTHKKEFVTVLGLPLVSNFSSLMTNQHLKPYPISLGQRLLFAVGLDLKPNL